MLELSPGRQVVRRRRRPALRQPEPRCRLDPRPRRRERRGQVDAREDRRRPLPPRRGRVPPQRRGRRLHARPPQSKAAGIAVIYQEPTLFPDLSVTENIFMGRQPVGRFGRIDRKAMRARGERALPAARRAHRPRPPAPRASRSPTSRSSRSRRRSRSTRGCSSWTSRPPRCRGVEVDRLFAIAREPPRRGPRAPVHLAPLRRGVRRSATPSPSCATAPTSRTDADRRHDASTSSCGRWSAATSPTCSRRSRPRSATPLLEVDGPDRARACSTTSRSRCAPARSSASPDSSAPGRSEVARAVFGVDGYDSGSVTLDGAAPSQQGDPRARHARRASRSCPRTGASRDSCSSHPSPATSTLAIRKPAREGGHHHVGLRERAPRRCGRAASR